MQENKVYAFDKRELEFRMYKSIYIYILYIQMLEIEDKKENIYTM